jgi:signal transduction histidine kinase
MLTEINYQFNTDALEKINNNPGLEIHRNLFLIYKEILNNIIRHSQARNVCINLRKEKNTLILKVNDDGIGFKPGGAQGNGLKNFQMRSRAINGSVKIDSQINQGTEITVIIKIP